MTSLFRAWTRGQQTTASSAAAAASATPSSDTEEPDIVLQVGGARFAAHSRLLVSHSGYFKSLIQARGQDDVVFVPNITPQQFWPLFAYMYTGFLELTSENIYQVLLATHLLHMPRALELCRNYLAQGGGAPLPPPPTVNVVKPIPSRKLPPFFRPFYSDPILEHYPYFRPQNVQPNATSSPKEAEEKCNDSDDSVDVGTTSPVPVVPKVIDKKKPDKPEVKKLPDDKIVVDVACCDGPVQFHRVLNDAYKSGSGEDVRAVECSDSDDSYIEIEEDNEPYDNCNAFSKSLQKQMTEDIIRKRDENKEQDTIYTCIYCEHTFKSQYCYQKHARRHINPVSIDAVNQNVETVATCDKNKKSLVKREVRLLDMNVQYYPCKSCGSKFPSYYFVHKHRKMCHAEELESAELRGQPEKKKSKTKDDDKRNKSDTEIAK